MSVNLSPDGGANSYHFKAANNTTGVLVATGRRCLHGYSLHNVSAGKRYVKLYNKATAPTVGTDTPVRVVCIEANSLVTVAMPHGLTFPLGIGFGITTGIADNDTTAPSANDVLVNFEWV